MDDPDARMDAAKPASRTHLLGPRRRPHDPRAPYHEPLEPDHEDELLLSIGQGLALLAKRESDEPEAIVRALAEYIEDVQAKRRRLPRDSDAALLALTCVFGEQLCRAHGWGWARVRRARAPGIVVISPDCRYSVGPRSMLAAALERRESEELLRWFERLADPARLPSSEPGRYYRLP